MTIKSEKKTIKELAEEDRPREKLLLKGADSLSDQELIAILLGSGFGSDTALDLATKILKLSDYNLNHLGRVSVQTLSAIRGIGPAKAITIIAALELGRRRKVSEALQRKQIQSSRDAYEYFSGILSDLEREEMWMLMLDNANHIIGAIRIGQGGITGTVVDVRVVFQKVLLANGTQFIVAHNHPSGNLTPSDADRSITKKMKDGAELLDLRLLDHLIIGPDSYYSFADNGML